MVEDGKVGSVKLKLQRLKEQFTREVEGDVRANKLRSRDVQAEVAARYVTSRRPVLCGCPPCTHGCARWYIPGNYHISLESSSGHFPCYMPNTHKQIKS